MALITLGINFTKNTSLQKGDTIYYLGTDSRVYKIGLVDIMGDDYIVCEITGDTLSQLTASSYIFFGKDNSKNNIDLEKRIEFNGKKYGFIPNLSKITTGEYVDLEEYGSNINANLHRVMSVLYREIDKEAGKYYSVKPYDPNELEIDKFKNLPMSITLSALDFFFYLGKNLLDDLNNYSKAMMKNKAKKH